MNIPNRLTVFRIALVPVFCILAFIANKTGSSALYLASGIVFAAASLTDLLDGYLARKLGLVTDLGKFMDPLADKMLTTAALLFMMREGVCSIAVLVLILSREFAVSGLRMLAASRKESKVISAGIWGKLKTAFQMLTIAAFYFGASLLADNQIFRASVYYSCWICAAMALVSGAVYFADHIKIFKTA